MSESGILASDTAISAGLVPAIKTLATPFPVALTSEYPKYWVTYARQNMDAGANPFGHALLLISEQKSDKSPIQVITKFGFYSQSPSSTTDPIIGGLKHILGFGRMDLQDSHGHLQAEVSRYLYIEGLFGTSFPITAEQSTRLQNRYTQAQEEEQNAIIELNMRLKYGYELHLKGTNFKSKHERLFVAVNANHLEYEVTGPSGKTEQGSIPLTDLGLKPDHQYSLKNLRAILPELLKITQKNGHTQHQGGVKANGHTRYVAEKKLAQLEGRKPRLKVFHLTMGFNFDTTGSHTCKQYALNMLKECGIIDQSTHSRLNGNKFEYAFPRYGSNLPPMHLVAPGEPEAHHSKRTGKTHYSRSDHTPLFWATMPQTPHVKPNAPSPKTKPAHTHHHLTQYALISNALSKVRSTESLLLEKLAQFNKEQQKGVYYQQLSIQLKRVQGLYNHFVLYNNNQGIHSLNGTLAYAKSTLNIAKLTLTPEKAHYSAIRRPFESPHLKKSLSGFLLAAIASTLLIGPVGISVTMASILYGVFKLHGYIAAEAEHAQARADYFNFFSTNTIKKAAGTTPPSTPKTPELALG